MVERKGDKFFNSVLLNIGISDDPKTRRLAYYSICVMFRFAIYSYIAFNYRKRWVLYICFLLGLFSALNLYSNLDGEQWWSRKFQFIIALLLIFTTILLIISKSNNDNKYNIIVPVLLFASLFGGVSQDILLFGLS